MHIDSFKATRRRKKRQPYLLASFRPPAPALSHRLLLCAAPHRTRTAPLGRTLAFQPLPELRDTTRASNPIPVSDLVAPHQFAGATWGNPTWRSSSLAARRRRRTTDRLDRPHTIENDRRPLPPRHSDWAIATGRRNIWGFSPITTRLVFRLFRAPPAPQCLSRAAPLPSPAAGGQALGSTSAQAADRVRRGATRAPAARPSCGSRRG